MAEAIQEYASAKTVKEDGYERAALPIYVTQSSKRVYPYGNFLSQVLGFCNADGEGMYGLEKSYEDTLAGTPAGLVTIRNPLGDEIPNDSETTYPAKEGSDLYLTIDANIQAIVEKYLANSVKVNNVQQRGVGLVMNVNTGEILAMAVENGFDPNDPYALSEEDMAKLEGLSDEEYTQLQGQLREAQWKNNAITELYYPGSVFKIVIHRRRRWIPAKPPPPPALPAAATTRWPISITAAASGRGARGAGYGPGFAEQLQHLLYPAGPADRRLHLL